MHITRREPNHIDERGEIRDLITEDIDAVTYITCNKGAVRGNHYHEHTVQWEYVISGSLECYSRANAEAPIERTVIKKGDLVLHPIGEHHGFRALEDSVILSFTKGPRRGENYEQDVVRLKEPLFT
jgi:quercetin dioxygenase-like cupin family protein